MFMTINSAFGVSPIDACNYAVERGEKFSGTSLPRLGSDPVAKYISDNHSFAGITKVTKEIFSMSISRQVLLSAGSVAAGTAVILITSAAAEVLAIAGIAIALLVAIAVFNDQIQQAKAEKKILGRLTAAPLKEIPARVLVRFNLETIQDSFSSLYNEKMEQKDVLKAAGISLAAALGTTIIWGAVVGTPFATLRVGLAADAALATANFGVKMAASA